MVHAPFQLIAFGLKLLSTETVRPSRLVIFETLYRNSDLVVAGRRYLYPVVVYCCWFAVFTSGGINVAFASQLRRKVMPL